MSKFVMPCDDPTFERGKESGVINGGTSWLWHIAHNLEELGHEAELIRNGLPIEKADVIIVQSEWYGAGIELFQNLRKQGTKLVVILGHFKGGVYYDANLIEADLFVTTWKGPVVDNYKTEVKFWPHAYCTTCDKGGTENRGDIPWIGNKYPLRDEGWLDEINPTKINGIMPNELGAVYRGAKVCPNIHGKFQMGEVSTLNSSLADVPGYACNERLFHITGAGGFQVVDNNEQVKEFFTEEEIVIAKDKNDFQKKINYYLNNPDERQPFIEKGRDRVMREHTYQHRVKQLLEWI